MAREYFPFIDWMKAAGIFLIVFGHVAGAPINFLVPPIYPKQLGVAFFLFVMGFSLAREARPGWQVLFNRLFEIYLFGIGIAVLMSAIMYAARGTLNLSNYLPFFLGANVLFNNFPANPTTWYIGTYLHVLVLWALVVRRVRVHTWMLPVSATIEVAIRAALLLEAGRFIAYMLVPNWMTVFLLGTWFGQRSEARTSQPAAPTSHHVTTLAGYSLLLAAFGAIWALLVRPHMQEYSFPFMRLSSMGAVADAVVTAVAVSVVYLAYTVLVFQVVRRTTPPAWVRFLSRNTLIVFIAHMPLFYFLSDRLAPLALPYLERAAVQMLVCLVGLALVSEFVRRVVRPGALRQWLFDRLVPVENTPTAGV
jgi:fucose 4-O-acetylase-like acetyltransferase